MFAPGTRAQPSRSLRQGRCSISETVTRRRAMAKLWKTGSRPRSKVEFTVRVIKGRKIGWPRGEAPDEILHHGKRASAGPGAATCDQRNDALAFDRLWPGLGRRVARPRAMRALRHREYLQSGVLGSLQTFPQGNSRLQTELSV